MKEVKLEAGTDILDVFYMLTTNKPSFANYNGFYIYAGCEEPPHIQQLNFDVEKFNTTMAIGTTQVYKINGRLVVASDVVEAVTIYKEYYSSKDSYNIAPEKKSVSLIKDGQTVSSSSALIRKS